MKKNIFVLTGCLAGLYVLLVLGSGCAQIGAPTGGAKDTLAPVLVRSSPENNNLNFTSNKITLVFDEYIEVKDIQANQLVSPFPKNNPVIAGNLKTVTIKLRDTLKPNTTYSINFGNAIADVHEGNIFKNFTYTFSTGNFIDSLEISGKVLLAETGKPDTTLLVMLYKNAADSDVTIRRPDYVTRITGNGSFKFTHLPPADFRVYALKDGDGGKTYNSKSETFAFIDTTVAAGAGELVSLYAYAEEKAPANAQSAPAGKRPPEKNLKYNTSLTARSQDLLFPLQFVFTNGLKSFDLTKIVVSDTNFRPLPGITPTVDSTRRIVSVNINWQPETEYYYILPKEAFEDSTGNKLAKTDTVRFVTKKVSDYGTLLLRFKNIDLAKHPVIQFLQNDAIKFSFPVKSAEWNNKRFAPGEYSVRILYDLNNNGIWDPGNYKEKRQPERSISLPQKLAIKADWDNEREIQL